MKRIQLSQGKSAIVDARDYEWLQRYKWFAAWNPVTKQWYAGRAVLAEERRQTGRKACIPMHQLLLPAPEGMQVDHKNQNGLDNRRRNLRLATPSQNCANRRRRQSKTGLKGVYHSTAPMEDFYALIVVKQKRLRLGRFADPMEAARAYDRAAVQHFGEFAVLNNV